MIGCATRFLHETGRLRYFGSEVNTDGTSCPSSPTKTAETNTLSDNGLESPLSPRGSSRLSSNLMTSVLKRFSRGDSNYNHADSLSARDSFFLSDNELQRVLDDTVYISPSWLCDVLKGVIRHERESLLRYFLTTDNQLMVRRVKRVLKTGRLHASLCEYTYPATEQTRTYWSSCLSHYESSLWDKDVVTSKDDIKRAFSLLSGFDLIAVKDQEFLIPTMLRSCNYMESTHYHSDMECRHRQIIEYISLPNGFFERIVIKINRKMFYSTMTSNTAHFYSLGDFGGILVSSNDLCTKLSISTTSNVILRDILYEITQVEYFFPGLQRQKVIYDTIGTDKMADETQVLIVGSSVSKVCMRIRNELQKNCPDLLVDTHAGKAYTTEKLKCRVAIICVDNRLSDTVQAVSMISALHDHGITMIPLIFEGYEIAKENNNNWWPSNIPALSSHKLYVDIRKEFHSPIREILIPVVKRHLNQLHSRTCNTSEDVILCDMCKVDCVDTISHFRKASCSLLLEEWHSKALEIHSEGVPFNSPLALSIKNPPIVICGNGHSKNVTDLMSTSVVKDLIPCPVCVRSLESKPFLFDRGELILQFEDELKKTGVVSCPLCIAAKRPSKFSITDILNTDVFFSYSWGRESLNQNLVLPFARKIELETDIMCWLDVQGGLSEGQDHIREMVSGVSKCSVFIMCVTDGYATSENCRREFVACSKMGKFIIPLLMPQNQNKITGVSSDGWSGTTSPWWKHFEMLAPDAVDPDDSSSKIAWFLLDSYKPVDLRAMKREEYMSSAGEEIICRILSRLHRGGDNRFLQHKEELNIIHKIKTRENDGGEDRGEDTDIKN